MGTVFSLDLKVTVCDLLEIRPGVDSMKKNMKKFGRGSVGAKSAY